MADETVGAIGAVTETQNNVEEVSTAKTETVGEGAPQTTANDGEQEQGKRKGGWQRKIEKLERENEFWREQALKTAPQPAESKPEAKEEPFVFSKQKPKPEDFRIQDTETFDQTAYLEAVADWKVDEREAKAEHKRVQESKQKEQQESKSKQNEKLKSWNDTQAKAAREVYDDYDEVAGTISCTPAMYDSVMESEVGGHLAYWIGTHPDEVTRISALTPRQQILELHKIEAQFAKEEPAAKSEDETPEPPVSKAPAPATPVRKPSAAPKEPSIYDENLSFKEYCKLREAQEKRK
jgi:hypothetical protein